MKSMFFRYIKVFTVVFIVSFLAISCQKDPHHMITQTWKMENEEFVLEIRPDSSYVVTENQKKPQVGKWRLGDDNKTISFHQKDNVVNMDIRVLTEEKFVLDNNGDAMEFVAAASK